MTRFKVKPHMSDIRMTYKCIRGTYGWHTSTYERHTDDIESLRVTYGWHRVHTSDIRMTYEWHTNDIRVQTNDIQMTYEYMQVTYRWHAVSKKNKVNFLNFFLIILFQNIPFVKELLASNGCFELFTLWG